MFRRAARCGRSSCSINNQVFDARRPLLESGLLIRLHAMLMRIPIPALWFSALALSHAAAEDEAASRGARVYDKYCATCHGDDLQNNSGVAFDLRRLKADEHPRFVNSVTHGKNAMPSWQGVLTAEQIEDLWAYIRAHAYQQ
jgi:mono/diheme cytochrome c family protein